MNTLSKITSSLFAQAQVAATMARDRVDIDTQALAMTIVVLAARLKEQVDAKSAVRH